MHDRASQPVGIFGGYCACDAANTYGENAIVSDKKIAPGAGTPKGKKGNKLHSDYIIVGRKMQRYLVACGKKGPAFQ